MTARNQNIETVIGISLLVASASFALLSLITGEWRMLLLASLLFFILYKAE